MNNKLDFIDIISVISFYIAIRNLEENEQQSDLLKNKLDEQDDIYLKKSIEQNELIIKQNEEIINLLKESKYGKL